MDNVLAVAEPLMFDSDRYKQRAGAELLSGLLRGLQNVLVRINI